MILLLTAMLLTGQDAPPRKIFLTRMYEEGLSRHWELSVSPDGSAYLHYQQGALPSFESARVEDPKLDFDFLFEVVQEHLARYRALSDEEKKERAATYSGRDRLRVGVLWEGNPTVDNCLVNDPELWNDLIEGIEPDLVLHSSAKEFCKHWETIRLDIGERSPSGHGSNAYFRHNAHKGEERNRANPVSKANIVREGRQPVSAAVKESRQEEGADWRWVAGLVVILLSVGVLLKLRASGR